MMPAMPPHSTLCSVGKMYSEGVFLWILAALLVSGMLLGNVAGSMTTWGAHGEGGSSSSLSSTSRVSTAIVASSAATHAPRGTSLTERPNPSEMIPASTPPRYVGRMLSQAVPAFSSPLDVGVSGQANGGLATWSSEFNPSVAEDSAGDIYLTWASDSTSGWSIDWAGSNNSGATFSSPAPTQLWTYSSTSGLALVGPSIAVTPSGGNICIVFLSSQESTDGGTLNDPYGDYYHACTVNRGGTWSSLTGDTTNGNMCSVATTSGLGFYGGVYDPVGAFDAAGNFIVAAIAAPTGDACNYRSFGWDVWAGGTTFSATYWNPGSIPDYFSSTNDLAISCGSATAGCATLYGVSNGNGNISGANPTQWLVDVVSSTNDFSSFTGPFTVATHAWTTGYSNVGAVLQQGDLAYAASGTNAAAIFDINAGSSTTVTFTVDYSYTSNDFTSAPTLGTSPAGGATGLGPAAITIEGSSAAPFVAWSTSANALKVTAATSQSGTWNTPVTVGSTGHYPSLAAYVPIEGSPNWRVDLAYIGTGTNPQVYYSAQTAPYVTAFNPSPSSIDANQSVTFNPTYAGGTGTYTTYSWSASSANFGCGVANAATYSCTPITAKGSPFNVTVAVTDSWGFVGTATSPAYTVYSDPTVGVPSAVPASGGIDYGKGGNVTFTSGAVTGGLAAYTYSWTTLPSWCVNSNAITMTCTPTGSGSFSVGVTVTDSNKFSIASPILNYTVNAPITAKLTGSIVQMDVGQTVNLTTVASGGSGTYTYSYTGLPAGCGGTTSTLACSPSAPGNFSVTATVVDSTGYSVVTNAFNLTVNLAPKIASGLTVTPSAIVIGASISVAVSATGGTGSLRYAYSGLPSGCTAQNVSSFSCTPTATGTSTVTVVITDAVGKSVSSSATVTVKPKNPPSISSFTASPSTITIGSSTTFTVVASGGTPPLTYVYTGLPQGCSSINQTSLKCTPGQTGSFTVGVTVTDAAGLFASSSTSLTVTSVSGMTISSFTAAPASTPVGQSTTFTVTLSGGTSPFTYLYTGLPTGCSSSNTASLVCTPTSSGSFSVTVKVTDSKQLTAQASTNLTVTGASGGPTISSFAASPNPVGVGQSTALTAVVSGGTAPYLYTYTGLPPGCASQDQNQLSCKPTSPGNYSVSLTVTDKNGHSTTKTLLLVVTGTISPLSVSLSSNASSIPVGSSVLLTALVTGGIGPFTYTWSLNGTNVSYGPDADAWSDSLTHSGTFVFKVWVSDAKGKTVGSQSVSVLVNPVNTTNSKPEVFPWWIFLVIAAAVAIGLILYVDHRRRTSRRAAQAHSVEAAMAVTPAGEAFTSPEPEATPPSQSSAEPSTLAEPMEPQYFPTPGEEAPAPVTPESVESTGEQSATNEGVPPDSEASVPASITEAPASGEQEPGLVPSMEPNSATTMEPYPLPEPEEPALSPDLPSVPPPTEALEPGTVAGTSAPPEDAGEALTNCPQCGAPLTSESYCPVCQLEWVREGAETTPDAIETPPPTAEENPSGMSEPEAPPVAEESSLTQCPQCGGPLDAQNGCAACGVIWERGPQADSEIPSESPPELPAAPEPSSPTEVDSPPPLPIPPPPDAPAAPNQEPEAPTLFLGKVCLVCGGPLDGDYCATCDMHWESGGPR